MQRNFNHRGVSAGFMVSELTIIPGLKDVKGKVSLEETSDALL